MIDKYQKMLYNININLKEKCVMNNKRRQQLKEWIRRMENVKQELESICSNEEESFDMMPEGLQSSTNGMNSEEAIDKMNDAIVCIEEAVEAIEEII
jgi:uncharacterized protein YhaN